MPVSIWLSVLYVARPLAGGLSKPATETISPLQHSVHAAEARSYHIGIQHHEGQWAITFFGMNLLTDWADSSEFLRGSPARYGWPYLGFLPPPHPDVVPLPDRRAR